MIVEDTASYKLLTNAFECKRWIDNDLKDYIYEISNNTDPKNFSRSAMNLTWVFVFLSRFSFTNYMTAGEGGAISTRSTDAYTFARQLLQRAHLCT